VGGVRCDNGICDGLGENVVGDEQQGHAHAPDSTAGQRRQNCGRVHVRLVLAKILIPVMEIFIYFLFQIIYFNLFFWKLKNYFNFFFKLKLKFIWNIFNFDKNQFQQTNGLN
jgi:hypothetical protein